MSAASNIMAGKRGLIMGVANERSIAWGIAKTAANHGAELAFTYQGDALLKRLEPLAKSIGSETIMQCDVTEDSSIEETFKTIKAKWGKLDFLVHAIAYSDKDELKGEYVNTTRDNFLKTLDISCYSFTSVAKQAAD